MYQSCNFPQNLPGTHRTGYHGQVDVQEFFGLQSDVQIWVPNNQTHKFVVKTKEVFQSLAVWYLKLLDHELCLIISVCNQTSLSTFYLLIWIILIIWIRWFCSENLKFKRKRPFTVLSTRVFRKTTFFELRPAFWIYGAVGWLEHTKKNHYYRHTS